jgi:hypothetical protein
MVMTVDSINITMPIENLSRDDAELMTLGAELEDASAAEREANDQMRSVPFGPESKKAEAVLAATIDRTARLVAEIGKLHASTNAGRLIKARAARYVSALGVTRIHVDGEDVDVVESLLDDLLAEGEDAELRKLWNEYLRQTEAVAAAEEALREPRAAFDAEYPPCPEHTLPGEHFRAHDRLWRKHGLDELTDKLNAAYEELVAIVRRVRQARASSPFGIGVKLAVSDQSGDEEDLHESVIDALWMTSKLTGVDFIAKTRATRPVLFEGERS